MNFIIIIKYQCLFCFIIMIHNLHQCKGYQQRLSLSLLSKLSKLSSYHHNNNNFNNIINTKLHSSTLVNSNSYKDSIENKINVLGSSELSFNGDVLIIPFYKPSSDVLKSYNITITEELKKSIPNVHDDLKVIIAEILDEAIFKADVASKQLIRLYGSSSSSSSSSSSGKPNNIGIKHIALVGLGPNPKKDKIGELEIKSAIRLGKSITSIAQEIKAESVGVILPTGAGNAGITPLLLSIQDSLYVDNRFKKVPEDGFPPLKWKSLSFIGESEIDTY